VRRIAYVDFLRAAAVVSIVFLHVTLANLSRNPAAPGSEFYYSVATVVATIWGNETLIFLSLLLALARPKGEDFEAFYRSRLLRVGAPFIVFTIFYVVLDAASRRQGVLFHFEPAEALILLIVAGLGEYHLHFLPALLILLALLPFLRRALPLPVVLALVLAAAAVRFFIQSFVVGATPLQELTAGQLLVLHFAKVLAYLPYGLLAQWFVAHAGALTQWRAAPLARLSIGAALFALLCLAVVLGGSFAQELLGSALIASGLFFGFVLAPERPGEGDAVVNELYSRAFLVLMIHPLVLRLFYMAAPPRQGSVLFDLLTVIFVLAASFLAVVPLRWLARLLWQARAPAPI
jgi:surface polysaccharide O-acyltransferase-like enzyme